MANKQAHAALSILKQSRILAPDVTEVGAIKHVMKLIANSLSAAKIAPAKVAWEATMAVRRRQTAFWSACQKNNCMVPSASSNHDWNWRRTWAK